MDSHELLARLSFLPARIPARVGIVWLSLTMAATSAEDTRKESSARPERRTSDTSWFYNYATQLVSDKHLGEELDVVDHQLQQLKRLENEMQPQYDILMKKYREAFTKRDYAKARKIFADEVNAHKAAYVERTKEVLLPHQVKRVEQLITRRKLMYLQHSNSPIHYASQDELALPIQLAERLELSDAQLERLKAVVHEERRKMQIEMDRLNKKALDEVVGSLPARKRRAFLELVGDPYDFTAAAEERTKRFHAEAKKRREQQEAYGP